MRDYIMVSPPRSHKRMMKPSKYANYDTRGFIKLGVFLAALATIILVALSLSVNPKTPATAEQVKEVIINQGYVPEDIATYYYESDSGFKDTLISCIAFESDDIHFEFFDFNNEASAISIYSQAYEDVVANNDTNNRRKGGTKIANYAIYTLDLQGKYNVMCYVGNTAVYACCDSENKNEIDKILDAIDYLKA